MATPNRIDVRVRDLVRDNSVSAGAIKPGHLLLRDSADKVVVHATADGFAQPIIALARTLEGLGIDDDYASGDMVEFFHAQRGDRAYMILAASQTIVIGDYLVPAGSGQIRKVGASTKQLLAIAKEAVTTGSGETARILVEII